LRATFCAGSPDICCAYETIAQSRNYWHRQIGEGYVSLQGLYAPWRCMAGPRCCNRKQGGEVHLNLHSLSYPEMSKLLIFATMISTRSGSMICGSGCGLYRRWNHPKWFITSARWPGLLHIYQLDPAVVFFKFPHFLWSHCSRAGYNITQHVIHASNYGAQAYVPPGISTLGPSSETQSQGRHDQGVDSN
jgi:hypothetical protein